jgi:site-specific DNA-methyltransferase (adenine-specific)
VSEWKVITGDCLDVLPTLDGIDFVIADPPYGMGKADWDHLIPPEKWLPLARHLGPVAVFTGVKGAWDYPRPDWTAAWVRRGSTQRNGALGGFNNWEPILLYGFKRLRNDTFAHPNFPDPDARWHPTPKPLRLMLEVVSRLPEGCTVLDPFCGAGTTGKACAMTGRNFVGIERNEEYAERARRRIAEAVPLCAGAAT